jgi:hypothetical protein
MNFAVLGISGGDLEGIPGNEIFATKLGHFVIRVNGKLTRTGLIRS